MTTFAVLGSGPSMSQEVADSVRERCGVVAVSDTYRLAPWADALVSQDRRWWMTHKDSRDFKGRKFCGWEVQGTELLPFDVNLGTGLCSGIQGVRVAAMLGATKILLLGFDMHSAGDHFFGKHPRELASTTPERMKEHLKQFDKWRGPEIVNCTPFSALVRLRSSSVDRELGEDQRAA